MIAGNVVRRTGILFAGERWCRLVAPGTVASAEGVETGGNGTATTATNALMASLFLVNIAVQKDGSPGSNETHLAGAS